MTTENVQYMRDNEGGPRNIHVALASQGNLHDTIVHHLDLNSNCEDLNLHSGKRELSRIKAANNQFQNVCTRNSTENRYKVKNTKT